MILNSTVHNNDSVVNRIRNPTAPLLLCIAAVIICAFTIIFNAFSIFIVSFMFKEVRKKKYLSIVSLSVTDMMVGITMIPIVDSYWNSNQYFTYYDCWFIFFGYSISFFVSILHIFVICIEHVLVLYGKISRANTYRRNITTILSIWSLGTVITAFEVIIWSSYRDLTECSVDNLFGSNINKTFLLTSMTWFTIQLGIVLCMLIMFIFVYKYRQYPLRSGIRRASAKDCNICLTSLLLAGIVLIFDWPITIVLICEGVDSNVKPTRNIRTISMLLSGLNSTINPVIYVFRTKRIRKRIRNLYSICKQCITCTNDNGLNTQSELTSAALQTFRGIQDDFRFEI